MLGGARTKSGVPLAAIRAKRLGLRAGVMTLVFLAQREPKFHALEASKERHRPAIEGTGGIYRGRYSCGRDRLLG